jgi:hypothetical protein
MMDTHVLNAQLELFLIQTTPRDATSQLVLPLRVVLLEFQDNQQICQSNSHLITSAVEDVSTANGHNTFQMPAELNAFLDQELFAQAAFKDNPMMDTHALLAQPVKLTLTMKILTLMPTPLTTLTTTIT